MDLKYNNYCKIKLILLINIYLILFIYKLIMYKKKYLQKFYLGYLLLEQVYHKCH